jgi:2-dehydropantoate 2-reductase
MSSVFVVGAGAIGTYLASALALHAPVSIVVRDRAKAEALDQSGLKLSFATDASAPRHTAVRAIAMADLRAIDPEAIVIMTMKATDLAPALSALRPVLGPNNVLVLAQNGLGVLEAAGSSSRVVRAACWMGILNEGLGRARVAGVHSIVLGGHCEGDVARVATLTEAADIPTFVDPDPRAVEWRKALWNLAVNALCAALDQPNGAMLEPQLRAAASAILDEAARVAAAEGVTITEGDRARVFGSLEVTRANVNSTLQDLRAGRTPETEWLSAAVSRIGRRHGIPTPLHDLLTLVSEYLEKSGIRKR